MSRSSRLHGGPSDKRIRYRLRYLILASVAALTLTVATGTPSLAAGSGPSFGLKALDQPPGMSYFVYDARPGQTLTGLVRVTNTGDATGAMLLYGVDGTTGQTSGVVFVEGIEPRVGVGSWMKTEDHQMTLSPGESRIVGFSVAVPAQQKPGQWVGGLVAENLTLSTAPAPGGSTGTPLPESSGGSLIVKFRALTILAVQVNVRGALRPAMEVTGVSTGGTQGHQTLLIGIRNTGNTMEKPTGTVNVTSAAGDPLQHLEFELDTVLPETAIDFPVPVRREALGVGCYLATVTMAFGTAGSARYSGRFCISQQEIEREFQGVAPLARPPVPPTSNSVIFAIAAGASSVLITGGLILAIASRRRRRRALLPAPA